MLLLSCCLPLFTGERVTLEQLATSKTRPSWLRPTRFTSNPDKPYEVFGRARINTAETQKAAARFFWATSNLTDQPEQPFYMLQAGRLLTDLNADAPAYQCLMLLENLPPNAPYNGRIAGFPDLVAVKLAGNRYRARILARNHLVTETLALLEKLPTQTGYDKVLAAEIHALAGLPDQAVALLRQVDGTGHPDPGFSEVFTRLRAMVLARDLDQAELAKSLAAPILAQERTAQKWPQWQNSWGIIDQTVKNLTTAEHPPSPIAIAPGTYRATCTGHVGNMDVEVTINGDRISNIRIVKTTEDRSWSAHTIIPARIVAQQDLGKVDVISGATVTSTAIITAVDTALSGAPKRE